MNLVFLGPPGVGKGTQAATVAAALNLAHISTGDLLRAAIAAGTKTGLEARASMDAGRLVPDEVVNRLVRERLQEKDAAGGALFDGYPRTPAQAQALDGILRDLGRRVDRVLDFQAPDAVVVERIGGRRTCPRCSAAYHVTWAPSRRDGECEKCGGKLEQRSDDRPETVKHRLEVYRRDTRGVSEHYRSSGTYVMIAADREIAAVTADVLEQLKGLK
ncbi:MAG: adenylate kinase [Candidatus Brocadiae bacterium]|nr:adenylate kinase [Candidatus Brocadiia bacterium]